MSSDVESYSEQENYDECENEFNNNNGHRGRHHRRQNKPKKPRWFNDVFNDEVQEATNSPLFKLVRGWVTNNVGVDLSYVIWGITLLAAARKYSPSILAWIERNGTNSTTLDENDPIARELLSWVSQQPTSQLFAWIPSFQAFEWKNLGNSNRRNNANKSEETTKLTTTLRNTRFFFFQGKAFLLQRERGKYNRETIILRCLWGNQEPMLALFQHVRTNTRHQKKDLEIRFVTAGGVSSTKYVERKLMKHFDMEIGPKQKLVTELQDFFDPRTEEYYHQNGTPYRKGLLLYGPPGTGKTSLSKAIAGEYGLELIVFNLADMTDALLMQRFDELPKQCVVLFEDIDSMGIVRETTRPADGSEQRDTTLPEESESEDEEDYREDDHWSSSRDDETAPVHSGVVNYRANTSQKRLQQDKSEKRRRPRTKVTLSGLLNTIDGPGTKEGRLVIFTTNAPNGLDEALIRPGRVDKRIYLGFSSHQTSAITFKRVYITDHQNKLSEAEIEKLAVEFGRKVPNNEFTTCKLNRYCMQMHRNQPQQAIDDVAEWVELERTKKNRPFEYDINDATHSLKAEEFGNAEETEECFEFEQNLSNMSSGTSCFEPEFEAASGSTSTTKFHEPDTRTLNMKPVSLQYAGAAALVGAAMAGFGTTLKSILKLPDIPQTGPRFYSPGLGRLNRYNAVGSHPSELQQAYTNATLNTEPKSVTIDKNQPAECCSASMEIDPLLEGEESDNKRVVNTPSTGAESSDLASGSSTSNMHLKFAHYREPHHKDLQGRRNRYPYHGPLTIPTQTPTAMDSAREAEATIMLRNRSPMPLDDAEVLILKHGSLHEEL